MQNMIAVVRAITLYEIPSASIATQFVNFIRNTKLRINKPTMLEEWLLIVHNLSKDHMMI